MAQMNAFRYTPLDLDRPALRLLRLKAAPYWSEAQQPLPPEGASITRRGPEIECELIEAFFDADFVPDYEAVSYTWGDSSTPYCIYLDGLEFSVTYNLWSLLHDIRSQDEDRILWIDAICINQSNDRERGHQVQQMDKIYRNAYRVIFWLGSLTESISVLMDKLAGLQKRMPGLNWSPTDYRWQLNWEHVQSDSLIDGQDTLRSALHRILQRPWFRRVWILQEVANARAAVVHCGYKSISARIFAVCPSLLQFKVDSHCQAVLDVMPGPSRRNSWWSQERDLFTLLKRFSRTQATREHDRIFALFGLCPEANAMISTDYKKSLPDLIRETASFICGCDLPAPPFGSVTQLCQNLELLHNRVLEELLVHSETSDVKSFLLEHKPLLIRSPELLCSAMSNRHHGTDVLKPIFSLDLGTLQLTTELVWHLLLMAVFCNDKDEIMVRLFLDHGLDGYNIDHQDAKGNTLLDIASKEGREKISRLLLDEGADPSHRNKKRETPLASASAAGHKAVAQLLIDRGASLDIRDLYGNTPLLLASRLGHKPVVEVLLTHGADHNARSGYSAVDFNQDHCGDTPLTHASRHGWVDIAQTLLDRGVDYNQKNNYGNTPLLEASARGQSEVVRLLLDRGANPNARNYFGKTPLLEGEEAGHEDVVQILLDHGACRTSRGQDTYPFI